MKKLIFAAAISLLLCAGGAVLWAHVSSDEFLDANAEALIETRGVEDRIVDCFSQSVFSFGASYWDCGNCQRYKNHAGTGNTRTCHPDTNQG